MTDPDYLRRDTMEQLTPYEQTRLDHARLVLESSVIDEDPANTLCIYTATY